MDKPGVTVEFYEDGNGNVKIIQYGCFVDTGVFKNPSPATGTATQFLQIGSPQQNDHLLQIGGPDARPISYRVGQIFIPGSMEACNIGVGTGIKNLDLHDSTLLPIGIHRSEVSATATLLEVKMPNPVTPATVFDGRQATVLGKSLADLNLSSTVGDHCSIVFTVAGGPEQFVSFKIGEVS